MALGHLQVISLSRHSAKTCNQFMMAHPFLWFTLVCTAIAVRKSLICFETIAKGLCCFMIMGALALCKLLLCAAVGSNRLPLTQVQAKNKFLPTMAKSLLGFVEPWPNIAFPETATASFENSFKYIYIYFLSFN